MRRRCRSVRRRTAAADGAEGDEAAAHRCKEAVRRGGAGWRGDGGWRRGSGGGGAAAADGEAAASGG